MKFALFYIIIFTLIFKDLLNEQLIFNIIYCIWKIFEILNIKKENIRIAVCTMGKNENLYVKEFIEYYMRIGIDHIFIYDDNEEKDEKIFNYIVQNYRNNVTIYETKKLHINNQSYAFNDCYNNNINNFDWFIMIDMDEFLYIVDDTLKGYLTKKRFNKCDFIKVNWVLAKDNGLIYYDPRPLFERFKPPYIESEFVKSIIRGNISDLKFWVHSPYISPKRNITCNNIGKRIYYKNMNFETIKPINIKKAYIIHFRYKSTEELVNKIKRGYKNWFGNNSENFLIGNILLYLQTNDATSEKINYIEINLKINLSKYIKDIKIL